MKKLPLLLKYKHLALVAMPLLFASCADDLQEAQPMNSNSNEELLIPATASLIKEKSSANPLKFIQLRVMNLPNYWLLH
jgi:hypothetical protein